MADAEGDGEAAFREENEVARRKSRKRSLHQLASIHEIPNDDISPVVCLTILALIILMAATTLGVFLFDLQHRTGFLHLGGRLEWNCSLTHCHLRVKRSTRWTRAALRKTIVKLLGADADKMDEWVSGREPLVFYSLMDLPFCDEQRGAEYHLFSGLCTLPTSIRPYSRQTLWSIVVSASRSGAALVSLSVLASCVVLAFIFKEHQVLASVKRPRWLLAELKTGAYRTTAKVCAILSPSFLLAAVAAYRSSIGDFEVEGGIARRTLLFKLATTEIRGQNDDSPWGVEVFLLLAMFQVMLGLAMLKSVLKSPERPLAVDVIDMQLEQNPPAREVQLVERHPPQAGGPASSPGLNMRGMGSFPWQAGHAQNQGAMFQEQAPMQDAMRHSAFVPYQAGPYQRGPTMAPPAGMPMQPWGMGGQMGMPMRSSGPTMAPHAGMPMQPWGMGGRMGMPMRSSAPMAF